MTRAEIAIAEGDVWIVPWKIAARGTVRFCSTPHAKFAKKVGWEISQNLPSEFFDLFYRSAGASRSAAGFIKLTQEAMPLCGRF